MLIIIEGFLLILFVPQTGNMVSHCQIRDLEKVRNLRIITPMNIKFKLTLTFLVLSLFVLIPVVNNTHMTRQIQKAMDLRNLVQDLATNIHHEEISAIVYVTETDENAKEKAASFIEHYEMNKQLISRLKDMVNSEKEAEILDEIDKWHEELLDKFNEVRHVREERIAEQEEISRLSVAIRDKRHEIRERYFPKIEFQRVISTPFHFEYEGVRYNASIAYIFRNLEYSEKEFLWQYRDVKTRNELVKSIGMFKAIVDASSLSDDTKRVFLSALADYTVLISQIEELIDPNSIEMLIQRKYIDSDALEDLTYHFTIDLIEAGFGESRFDAPVTFNLNKKQYYESLSFVLTTMRYREKEYLWQENNESLKNALNEEIAKFSAIMTALNMSAELKVIASEFLQNYVDLVRDLDRINNMIEVKTHENAARQTRMISELSEKADIIQNGGSPGFIKGIAGLIYLSEQNMDKQVQRSVTAGRSVGILVVFAAIIIGVVVSQAIAGPVMRLKNAADEIGKGNLDVKPGISSKDEIGELANSFVKMAYDLKTSQEAVMKSETKYRTLFESSPDPITIVGADAKVVDCNDSALELFKKSKEEVVGKSFADLNLINSENITPIFERMSSLTEETAAKILDAEMEILVGGEKRWLQVSVAPIWSGGKVESIQIISRDITERKEIMIELDRHKSNLEEMVEKRTTALRELNRDLRVTIEERKAAEERLKTSEHSLRKLAQQVISMQEEERTRLARDLHDLMGQQLSAMGMEIDWMTKLKDLTPEHLKPLGERMEKINKDLHVIYRGLRPMELEKLGLSAAMKSLIWETEGRVAYKIKADIETISEKISAEKEISFYRILQETLTNIIRHSDAKNVHVEFKKDGANLVLRVEDDGKGFDIEEIGKEKSFGLAGIQERALLCGGEMKVDSKAGKGSLIEVSIPL